ncbi:hypothetical protein TCAL_03032 [Tigriopus californicus]|uniref:VWFD domain-containing protein n=1 Tax=Tigriopus californicus TaxID=6832 RepID=A0A553NVB1_TIGCA|nr:uncharacterized protein LOC131883031 [Tigriopus californicus]TRY69369.1 hypothetical protein TCAL_03032 [Tigriopus californicus]|eukprot:TCALIF_03032-PA protein Name:"Protein of unknown function" AED:0.00 eAED:0.00 QI:61/1/1/1/1/1/2/79/443
MKILPFVSGLVVLTWFVQCQGQTEDCQTKGEIPISEIVASGGKTLQGCPYSYFVLTIEPLTSIFISRGNFELQIKDGGESLPTFTTNVTRSLKIATKSDEVTLTGSGDITLKISFQEFPLILTTKDIAKPLTGREKIADLQPNSRHHYNFDTIEGVHELDVTWNLQELDNGFLAVRSGNGRIGLLSVRGSKTNQEKVAVMVKDEESTLQVDLITQNSIHAFSNVIDFELKYNLAEKEIITTTQEPSTEPTLNPDMDPVEIFVVAVNEEDFAASNAVKLQDTIENWAQEYISGSNGTAGSCNVQFFPLVSCRQICQMTADIDRGCVAFFVNVVPNIFCPYTNSLLRRDVESDKQSELDGLVDEFKAKRIIADNCLQGEHGWLIMTILLPVGTVVFMILAAIVMSFANRSTKMKKTKGIELDKSRDEADPTTLNGPLPAYLSVEH